MPATAPDIRAVPRQIDVIAQTLGLLCPDAAVEIRIAPAGQKELHVRRFADYAAAVAWVLTYPTARAAYVVMNPFDEARIKEVGVDDAAVTRRCWLLIDGDPERHPRDSNATDAEHEAALAHTQRIKQYLTEQGWPDAVEADSGNGGHLLYAIDLPNDADARVIVQNILKALASMFDTAEVRVDCGNFNAARITKLYGTAARKAAATDDRPHRLSALTHVPDALVTVPLAALQRLAALGPKTAPKSTHTGGSLFDLSRVLPRLKVYETSTGVADDGTVATYYHCVCPWVGEHGADPETGSCLIVFANGAIAYKCHHSHCVDRQWPALRDHFGIKPKAADRIVIQGGQLTDIVDRAQAALLKGTAIYQRGGMLTRAIRLDTAIDDAKDVRREAGSTMLIAVREPWLIEQMAGVLAWVRYMAATKTKAETYTPADPPAIYARTLLGRGEWPFPVLRGVITAPTLARDGRIIETPGFDAASGLLLDFSPGSFQGVIDDPTRDDARDALAMLQAPLRGFPFVTDAAKAVALSALLTALVRSSLRTAPLHGIDAPAAGTGKSLIAEMAGLLAMGFRPPALSQGKTAEEDEKRLATVLFAGDPVIHIDNCEQPISGDFLCSMLTQEIVQARILGLSERRVLPSTALVLASGNNLTFAGDTSRRAVICRLDAKVERPDARAFDFDPHEEVLASRPELVVAGLTILRAYHLAERPEKLTPMGSFTDWEWIRGALVWLGCADPADTRVGILDGDPEKEELIDVMDLWWTARGAAATTVAEINAATEKEIAPMKFDTAAIALRDRLAEVACRGKWNAKSVGWWLRGHKDRVVGGRCFRTGKDKSREWRLEVTK